METNLRPLTLGEILDRTAQLYRTHFLLFAGIASVYAGVLLVLSLVQIAVQEIMRSYHMTSQIQWVTVVGILVMWPVIVIVGGFAVAANNRAVSWVHLGESATIRAAYRSILPRLGRYLWLMVITTFIVWIPFGVLYAGYAVFLFLYVQPKGILNQTTVQRNPEAFIVFGLVTLALGILLFAAAVYAVLMGLRYSLAVPACVIEDLKARQAIRRSIELSKGARGRIFVLGLLVVAVQIGLGLITQIFFIVATFRHHGELPAAIRVLQQLVAFCTNTFVAPIYATGFTLFYYDQRVRKEGYDIERMMRAAGLEAPAQLSAAERTYISASPQAPTQIQTEDPLA
jgi:glycerophosphoryl diester phosphodiesterase family protein